MNIWNNDIKVSFLQNTQVLSYLSSVYYLLYIILTVFSSTFRNRPFSISPLIISGFIGVIILYGLISNRTRVSIFTDQLDVNSVKAVRGVLYILFPIFLIISALFFYLFRYDGYHMDLLTYLSYVELLLIFIIIVDRVTSLYISPLKERSYIFIYYSLIVISIISTNFFNFEIARLISFLPMIILIIHDFVKMKIEFAELPEGVKVIETFDPENENSEEMQRGGW